MIEMFKIIPVDAWSIIAIGIIILLYYVIKWLKRLVEKRGADVKGFIKIPGEKKSVNCPETHVDCPRKNDVMIIVSKTAEVTAFEFSSGKSDLIQEQMDYADHVMTNLLNNLQKYYIDELKRIQPGVSITHSNDFLDYEKTLELFKGRLMNSFRKFCKQNHFSEMDESEFENYRTIKAQSLMNEGSKYLNDLYMYEENISRERLYELNAPHIPEFINTIKDIITNARKVAIKNKQDIIDKTIELLDLLEAYVGKENVILEVWKKQHGLI